MYRLLISVTAKKQLKKLKRVHQKAIIAALEDIKDNPLAGKPLTRELTGKFSYRVGILRIIYKFSLKDKTIYVLTAGHRATIYN